MNAKSKFDRKEEVWNPVVEGGYPSTSHNFDVILSPVRVEQPLHWKKSRRIFACSMSDLFHESVPDEFIDCVFAIMALCPQHTFQVLTKRPQRMVEYFKDTDWRGDMISDAMAEFNLDYSDPDEGGFRQISLEEPLPNIWLGVTATNQEEVDERVPILTEIPAAIRFISLEPLLEPVEVPAWCLHPNIIIESEEGPAEEIRDVDWVIVGGESGPGARAMHMRWVKSIRDQCMEAGVPFCFKTWGEWLPIAQDGEHVAARQQDEGMHRTLNSYYRFPDRNISYRVGSAHSGRLLDGREWDEYPG